jgi:hypothetical protein
MAFDAMRELLEEARISAEALLKMPEVQNTFDGSHLLKCLNAAYLVHTLKKNYDSDAKFMSLPSSTVAPPGASQ